MVRAEKPDKRYEVGLFLRTIWFFLLFFALLLMIASFGLIAET